VSVGVVLLNTGAADSLPAGDNRSAAVVRIPYVHGCRLTTATRVRGGLVCNLSAQGAYVTLDEPLPEPGETVQLAVVLPGQEPIIQAEAVVACQSREAPTGPDSLPPGIGLRFVSLPGIYKTRVESLVRQYSEGRGQLVLASPPHAGPRRVPYMRYGQLTTGAETHDILICNLSRLGAYIAVQPRPEVGDDIRLSFVAPDGTALDVKGVVTWRSPDPPGESNPLPPGCGVRFALSKIDEARLRSIVDTFPRYPKP
jgi:hypothetical protein